MKQVKHWQDPVNAVLGAWLVLSPWLLGFSGLVIATTCAVAIGLLLVASSVGAMQVPQAWEEWMDVGLGVALVIAPWLLGFDGHPVAMQNALATGLAVTVLAVWVLLTDKEVGAQRVW
jgi:hypothetical protein